MQACTASSDQPSEIHYRPYDSWATQADWTLPLPASEEATCVATGGPPEDAGLGHVIVSTTKGVVRFFAASGIQRYLWRLGEDVVSMSAGKEAVVIVHREGGTSLDGRCLSRHGG
jgi:chromosome transmission fidelity protein 4